MHMLACFSPALSSCVRSTGRSHRLPQRYTSDAEKGGAEIEPQGSHGASLRQQVRSRSLAAFVVLCVSGAGQPKCCLPEMSGAAAYGSELIARRLAHPQPQGRQPSLPLERHRSGAPNGSGYGGGGAHSGMDQEDDKYARRAHPLKRTLQRVLPGLFPAASLPVTLK